MARPDFMLRGYRRPWELVLSALGKLEREVMENVWARGDISVRDLHIAFNERVAYTTLMTTLDRLYKKGLLNRWKEGRAFIYNARASRAELERGITSDVIEGLLGSEGGAEPVLSCIVNTVSEHDHELLDSLERLIKEKQKTLKRKG
jgi:predicted transcriptional regulator